MAEIKPWRFLSGEVAKALQGLVFEDVSTPAVPSRAAGGEGMLHASDASGGGSPSRSPRVSGYPPLSGLAGPSGLSGDNQASAASQMTSPDETSAYQQRQLTRIACLFRVSCEVDRVRFKATVVDLGVRGMRLDVPQRVPEGSLLRVRYLGSSRDGHADYGIDEVTVRVQWCRKKRLIDAIEIGVLYEDEEDRLRASWVSHVLRQVGFDVHSLHDRRTTIRVQAWLHSSVATDPGSGATLTMDATVVNLGAGGALVEAASPLSLGTTVRLQVGPYAGLGALRCTGVVVSCQAVQKDPLWRMGVRFTGVRRPEAEQLLAYVRTLLTEAAEL